MLLKSDSKTLDLNAVMALLRRCNTAAEFRVFCAADGVDADKVVWAAMQFMLHNYYGESDKNIRQDITVEDLYKYRPDDINDCSDTMVWKLGMSLNMMTLPEYHMLVDAAADYSNLALE